MNLLPTLSICKGGLEPIEVPRQWPDDTIKRVIQVALDLSTEQADEIFRKLRGPFSYFIRSNGDVRIDSDDFNELEPLVWTWFRGQQPREALESLCEATGTIMSPPTYGPEIHFAALPGADPDLDTLVTGLQDLGAVEVIRL